jgi:hypothetical protein
MEIMFGTITKWNIKTQYVQNAVVFHVKLTAVRGYKCALDWN